MCGVTRGVMVSMCNTFPSWPEMLEYGFESWLGLYREFIGVQCVAFSRARRRGFSPGTPVSFPPSSVNGSANEIKRK